ncbi:MAG: methyltransferase domain-containing protein, partial [Bryobacteraceae bacterium]
QMGGSRRHFADPMEMLGASVDFAEDLGKAGIKVEGARIMEVGTGRRIDIPIGLYLAGVGSTITMDVNRLVRGELAMQGLRAMQGKREEILELFSRVAPKAEVAQRFDSLMKTRSMQEVLKAASVEYVAPADAAETGLPSGSIDAQISYTVFEHIPGPTLRKILLEANRILKPGGVALHHIDPSDHFWHEDKSISAINFLRFSDAKWEKLSGNPFGYHNRLRATDFEVIYREAHQQVLRWEPTLSEEGLALLKNGFPVDAGFRGKSVEDLATVVLRVLSKPAA